MLKKASEIGLGMMRKSWQGLKKLQSIGLNLGTARANSYVKTHYHGSKRTNSTYWEMTSA